MSSSIVPFKPTSAEEHARAETDRKKQLFAWGDSVLQQLGIVDRVSRANSFEDLHKITFDADAAEVELAIRDALHPVSGTKADCFTGMHEGQLKQILKARFDDLEKQRKAELSGGARGKQSTPDWTVDLKLDAKGGVRPLLTNLILFLRWHPQWKGVLAFDAFNARVSATPWRKTSISLPPWRPNSERRVFRSIYSRKVATLRSEVHSGSWH